MRKLYFDIETVKGTVDITSKDIKAPSNYTDPVKIAAYQSKKIAEIHDKAGLNSFTGKICCIGWAIDDEPVQYLVGIDEEKLIREFTEAIGVNFTTWIGHNILIFDLPYLYHRAIKYGIKELKNIMPETSRGEFTADTMKLVNPTDYKSMVSLDKCCKYFGIKTPKDGIDGSMVQGIYDAGEFDRIGRYCVADVEATRELYKLIKA